MLLLILCVALSNCAEDQNSAPSESSLEKSISVEIPAETVDLSALTFDRKISRWKLDTALYSGYCTSHYSSGQIEQKFGVFEGKKQGLSEQWYPDGHLKSSANYHLGNLNGEKKFWSPEAGHMLLSQLNYLNGKGHGVQQKWYNTGETFVVMNLNMGKEEGMQKAYRKNGDLYANYEAKEGRIFGMKKAQLCFGIEEETVNYEGE